MASSAPSSCSPITRPARLYVSAAILAEYREVLARPELKIRKRLRLQLLQLIESRSYAVKPGGRSGSPKTPTTTNFWNAPTLPARIPCYRQPLVGLYAAAIKTKGSAEGRMRCQKCASAPSARPFVRLLYHLCIALGGPIKIARVFAVLPPLGSADYSYCGLLL